VTLTRFLPDIVKRYGAGPMLQLTSVILVAGRPTTVQIRCEFATADGELSPRAGCPRAPLGARGPVIVFDFTFPEEVAGVGWPKCAAHRRPHAEEHRSTTSAGASTAQVRCDASRSMRAMHPSRLADLGTQFCRSRVNPRSVPSSSFETRARFFDSAEAPAHARSSG
jgi:hypothetical protein